MAIGWALLLLGIFIWQSATYRGLVSRVAEWQFDHLGRYFPTLSVVLLLAVFALPATLLIRTGLRRAVGPEPVEIVAELDRYGKRFLRSLSLTALAFAAAALGTFLIGLAASTDKTSVATVTLGSASADSPREGPTRLIGRIDSSRAALYEENLLAVRHLHRFVPVLPAAAGTGPAVRYFVDISADQALLASHGYTGILRHNALPGEVVQLYRNAGFAVATDHYVLVSDRRAVQWPYWRTAGQFLAVSAIFVLAALLQWWRYRRNRRKFSKLNSTFTTPTEAKLTPA